MTEDAHSDDDQLDNPPIASFIGDIDLQIGRLRRIAAGTTQVTPDLVLQELHATVLPLLKDVLPYIDRLEDHAEWASNTLEYLTEAVSGDTAESSQLARADALKFQQLLAANLADTELDAQEAAPGSKAAERAASRKARLLELQAVVEEITLEPEDSEGSDEEENDTPAFAASGQSSSLEQPEPNSAELQATE